MLYPKKFRVYPNEVRWEGPYILITKEHPRAVGFIFYKKNEKICMNNSKVVCGYVTYVILKKKMLLHNILDYSWKSKFHNFYLNNKFSNV